MTKGDAVGLFEPLDFFRLLDDLVHTILAKKTTPLSHINRIRGLSLTDDQRYFLLSYLTINIGLVAGIAGSRENQEREQHYDVCFKLLLDEFDEVKSRLFTEESKPYSPFEFWFSFDNAAKYADTLSSTKEKIAFFTEVITNIKQVDFMGKLVDGGLIRKCDLEIAKLEKLMALEASHEGLNESRVKTETTTRDPEHTLARKVLVINYLLKYAKIGKNVKDSDLIDFTRFLVGGHRDNVRKRHKEPYKDNRKAYLEDMMYVKEIFQKLKATEIVKIIDNDIERRNDLANDQEDKDI